MTISMNRDRSNLTDVVLFSILIGILATLYGGYAYGSGHHLDHEPVVRRAMDPTFLTNDFYTNANDGFGPRYYFSRLVAALAALIPLPFVYFLLTMVSNCLVALITALAARDLFRSSGIAALLACAVVMSIETFSLGSGAIMYAAQLNPGRLAMPLVLLSVWAGLRQAPILCAASAGFASLLHPTFGLEAGAVALGGILLVKLLRREGPSVGTIAAGVVILAAFAAANIVPYRSMVRCVDSRQFVDIVARFRKPHESLPSSFGKPAYLEAAGFLLAAGISWLWWKRDSGTDGRHVAGVASVVALIILLCIPGYFFVEVVPTRIWAVAQTFRLLILLKWGGLVLFSGTIARLLEARSRRESLVEAPLIALGLLSPLTTALAHVSRWLRESMTKDPWLTARVGPALTAALILGVLWTFSRPDSTVLLLFIVFLAMAVPYILIPWSRARVVAGGLAVVLVIACAVGPEVPVAGTAVHHFGPKITFSDFDNDEVDIGLYARHNTPQDAVFLTPPSLGQFRITAERAIIVDFISIPYQDPALLEWHRRILDVYGTPKMTGFKAKRELDEMYREIDDSTMIRVANEYGASYAVLYNETETGLTSLYSNGTYKVVSLNITASRD